MIKFRLFIFSSFLLISTTVCNAYDSTIVHKTININATLSSNIDSYLINDLGFLKGVDEYVKQNKIIEWFAEGGEKEDEGWFCRARNHFHDPTKIFEEAGLDSTLANTLCLLKGYSVDSSVIWAQKESENEWSWPQAREFYYDALTAQDNNMREQNFADTFRSLGQVMHLVADGAVKKQ